jgi:hypothetical protein
MYPTIHISKDKIKLHKHADFSIQKGTGITSSMPSSTKLLISYFSGVYPPAFRLEQNCSPSKIFEAVQKVVFFYKCVLFQMQLLSVVNLWSAASVSNTNTQ